MKTGIFKAFVATTLILVTPSAAVAADPTSTPTPLPIGLDQACHLGERVEYKDLRKIIDIDVDTASRDDVFVKVSQILSAGTKTVKVAAGAALDGTLEDARKFLKTGMEIMWADDLRVLTSQTMDGAGKNVMAAASMALEDGSIDAQLVYLNTNQHRSRETDYRKLVVQALSGGPEVNKAANAALNGLTFEHLRVFLCSGWKTAHDLDVASVKPTPTPTQTPTPTPTPSKSSATPTPTKTTVPPTLPQTGANSTGLVLAGIVLLLGGAAAIVLARRRRA